MQKVIILTETEYEDLKNSDVSLKQLMKDLERLVDKPEELREYILNKLN